MKDIPGMEKKYSITRDGKVWSKYRLKWIKIFKCRKYIKISLYPQKRSKKFFIHRLVAKTYIPNLANKPFVNHKNGVGSDNRVENLEWCTEKENFAHAVLNGFTARGERQAQSKLTEQEVLEIREMYSRYRISTYVLAEMFGIGKSQAYYIVAGLSWKFLLKKESP